MEGFKSQHQPNFNLCSTPITVSGASPALSKDDAMAGDDNEADVFAIPDFWQTSKWLEQLIQEAPTPLFAKDLNGEPICPCREFRG